MTWHNWKQKVKKIYNKGIACYGGYLTRYGGHDIISWRETP